MPTGLSTLPELRGRVAGLEVRLRELPFRIDELGRRRYPWRGFGCEFLDELAERRLPPFEALCRALASGPLTTEVTLRGLAPIRIELSGNPGRARDFGSNLADALIEAFRSAHIEP